MGQTLSLATLPGGSAGIDVPELGDLTYEKALGTARLMKCLRARHQDGLVVVKLVMKPFANMDLKQYVRSIKNERDALFDVPNALGYNRIFETNTIGYVVRQYIHSSLYDRISTRPFLEEIEKKWLAYQLLCAVRDSHAREIYHGDIKTENVLVTSWNWLYLTDYSSSYKPTRLPEDNPADFSFYFDTSGRRTCYLAPERFLSAKEIDDGRGITWAMDVFSTGCVIAELFTEAPIFNLSQLFKYRNGEYDPKYGYLNKIHDDSVRDLVAHMIQLQPESRYSADEYLQFWKGRAFPEYFYSFLHQYMGTITDPSSGRTSVQPETENFGEADDRIDRVYFDFDKISYFLNYGAQPQQDSGSAEPPDIRTTIPVQIDIPNNRHQAGTISQRHVDDGSLIFLTLVISSLRHTARATARIRACDLLLAFAEHATDEAKLDRILPFVVALLNDRAENVKIAALRTMTQILAMVNVVSPTNAYAFTEYIAPRTQQFISGPGSKGSPLVRATYASCISSLAHSASRLLDIAQALKGDGSVPTLDQDSGDNVINDLAYQNMAENARNQLLDHFEAHTKALLTDKDTSVRRAILGSVSGLCVFFGTSRANDVVLSHLNTYLNDKDWILKCAFLRTIVGVATFVGGASLEEYILPLMVQALSDPEDFVVQTVITSFASMAEIGLFQRSKTWEMIDIVARFMVHPNIWIREAAAHFVAASTQYIALADRHCIVGPLIQPYLKIMLMEFTEYDILDALKKPLPPPVLEIALAWASKSKKSLFWRPAPQQHQYISPGDQSVAIISSQDLKPGMWSRLPKSEEDEQWIQRLKNAGFSADDEIKLLALKEYVWRLAQKRARASKSGISPEKEDLLSLKDLQVNLQTVFFEERKNKSRRRLSVYEQRSSSQPNMPSQPSRSIADALLDASTSTNNEQARNKPARNASHISNGSGTERPGAAMRASSAMNITRNSPSGNVKLVDRRHKIADGIESNSPSDGSVTPAGSVKAGPRAEMPGIRHRSSAINLMSRGETAKASAEIGTDNANATGWMNGPVLEQLSTSPAKHDTDTPDGYLHNSSPINAGHTYGGNDPAIWKLLDSLALENYPRDVLDFGRPVVPISKQHSAKGSEGPGNIEPWRPQGVLVANFAEHKYSINRVLPSPDHAFFITGSDDGTVKIWDTFRLERNLAHRSRQTFVHSEKAGVTSLCFVENTHTFVSAAIDGTVKVVKVDHSLISDTPKYGRMKLMREYRLSSGEHAVWLEHAKVDTASLLVIATSTSRIIGLDLKNMKELFRLQNPVHHGTPTCFCVDHEQGWLLLGTSHGVLDLWDIRFHLRLNSWGLSGASPIHRVIKSPIHGQSRRACVTGGTGRPDMTIWDIEKSECREVFRVGNSRSSKETSTKAYDALETEEEKQEGMLNRFANAINLLEQGAESSDQGFRALAFGLDHADGSDLGTHGYFLSGGADRNLRFWAWPDLESSMLVSGLEAEEPQPKYSTAQPTTGLTIHTERPAAPATVNAVDARGRSKKVPRKQSRNTVINLQQQTLLRNHLDEITDVCLLESPVRMTVSVDRMGCIYVFQ